MATNKKKIIIVVVLVLVALASEFLIANYASDPNNYKHTIESLNEKKVTVMELTAASAGASILVAAIPGDSTTPIANKLADISTYLLVVLTAIFLEKYIIVLAGMLAFRILIPIICILIIAYLFTPRSWMTGMAKKLLIFALTIVLVVPLSVQISDLIEATKDMSSDTVSTESITDDTTVSSNKVGLIDEAKETLNNFIEDVAIMLVTSCLIPILVFVFLLWFIKMLFGINTDGALPSNLARKIRGKKKPEQLTSED